MIKRVKKGIKNRDAIKVIKIQQHNIIDKKNHKKSNTYTYLNLQDHNRWQQDNEKYVYIFYHK